MRIHIIKFLNRALEPGVIIHASNLHTLRLRRKTTSLKPAWGKKQATVSLKFISRPCLKTKAKANRFSKEEIDN